MHERTKIKKLIEGLYKHTDQNIVRRRRLFNIQRRIVVCIS